MPLARQKGQRTSVEPRAVHESVVPEASIGGLGQKFPLRFERDGEKERGRRGREREREREEDEGKRVEGPDGCSAGVINGEERRER